MREKKTINVQIGNEIRKARELAGLTQEQFGEIMQLGTKNVSDIERGVVGISISTLKRICERLPVSSDTLLFGSDSLNDTSYLTEKLKVLSPQGKKSARNCQFPATPFCLGSKRKTMLRIWRNGWSGYRQNSLQQ